MKIRCDHGFFRFYEEYSGEASDFMFKYEVELEVKDNYFTFKQIAGAMDYSLFNKPYLSSIANKTFQGKPWEVFKANKFTFDFLLGLVIPIDSVTYEARLDNAGNVYKSLALIVPGTIDQSGNRIISYLCFFNSNRSTYTYSGVEFG